MPIEIPKAYEPHEIEQKWARAWVEQELFRADANAPGPVFSIVIPPPNVTGLLHIGHMLDHTEIDILTRWHRMRGDNTLYLPGTDHAAISTQRVVVRQLQARGIDYRALGREKFLDEVWRWKEESGGTIARQMVEIGESCDWSRERFTLSPEMSRAVTEVFVRLYEDGLIYRGHYIVNWCPQCRTALSDLEVVHQERQGHLWHIRYPLADGSGAIVVATTRPETMLGDTGVAVHPDDERYAAMVGKKVRLPLIEREIPIVADRFVDREFGTGAVKVTPAHDPNDFEMGRRHNLAEIEVMTDDATMSEAAGPYAGLERFAARERIVHDLEAQGLLERVTDHTHAVGTCDRCGTVVEPRASTQWFVKMKPLADPAIAAVERGDIEIVPEHWRGVYFEWMRNIRDWCISRQIWWGHRIPAWHCGKCKEIIVARTAPAACPKCGTSKPEQDPDTLETWFSSALWPFSTMGWPDETPDYKTYYPTSLLITGYDILFFWVARMIMMGLRFTGQVPFRRVYLHSLVRTAEGQKMSKSKGTGLDPIELNQKFGTDAMRFTLASMAAPGTDIVLSEDRILSYRAFANKIWNAARFLFMNLDKFSTATGAALEELAAPDVRDGAPYAASGGAAPLADRWIFARIARVTEQVNEALEGFRFHEAAHVVYHFFWGDFCDWYIEWVKPELSGTEQGRSTAAWKNLFAAFETSLRLLHPIMPFLTEELWQKLPQRVGARSIALERFPEAREKWKDDGVESDFALIQEIITAARNLRAEMKVDTKRKVAAEFFSPDAAIRAVAESHRDSIARLATLSDLRIGASKLEAAGGALRSTAQFDLRIAYGEAVDAKAELPRLAKERERLTRDIESKRARLADATFRERAPGKIVADLEQTLAERQVELEKTIERIKEMERLGGGASS
ncbi:MAG: valine--tRNA ligase [Candidatus Acidiferrales bacterium]